MSGKPDVLHTDFGGMAHLSGYIHLLGLYADMRHDWPDLHRMANLHRNGDVQQDADMRSDSDMQCDPDLLLDRNMSGFADMRKSADMRLPDLRRKHNMLRCLHLPG